MTNVIGKISRILIYVLPYDVKHVIRLDSIYLTRFIVNVNHTSISSSHIPPDLIKLASGSVIK